MSLSIQEGTNVGRHWRVAKFAVSTFACGLLLVSCSASPETGNESSGAGAPEASTATEQQETQADQSPTSSPGESKTTATADADNAEGSTSAQGSEASGGPAVHASNGDGRTPPPLAEPVEASKDVRSGELTVGVGDLKSVELDDSIPGEVAGPSSAVEIQLRNDTNEEVSVEQAFAQAEKGDEGEPAVERDGRREGDFGSPLKPGENRNLSFVFAGSPDEITKIIFGYTPDQELLQFEVR